MRYEAVNAMLLNEFLKEHRKVEQLTKDFGYKLAEEQKQVEALTAGLEEVSAQLELNKSAPQTILNDQAVSGGRGFEPVGCIFFLHNRLSSCLAR